MKGIETEPGTDPVLAVCETHDAAQSMVDALRDGGYDLTKLSIVGKGFDAEDYPAGYRASGDDVRASPSATGFWNAIWNEIAGPSVFVVPQVGTLAAAGPVGAVMIAVLEGATVLGNLSALGSALVHLGGTEHAAAAHEAAVKADRFLVIVHGDAADVAAARAMLGNAHGTSVTR